jgi:capsular exopolysaccharide synthesis family protein
MPYANDKSESPLHLPEQSPAESSEPAVVKSPLAPMPGYSNYGPAVAMSPLPPALAAAPDMKSLLKSLKRHWLLATTLGLLAATAASTAVWFFTPVRYTAEVILRLNMEKLVKIGHDDKGGASPFTPQTLASLAKMRFMVREALNVPGVAQLSSYREQLEPVEWLRSRIDVGYMSPELLSISISGSNPAELITLVTAVAQVYETQLGIAERDVRLTQVNKLKTMIERLQQLVKDRRKNYEDFVRATGSANITQREHKAQFDALLAQTLLKDRVSEEQKLERLTNQLRQAESRQPGKIYIPEVEVWKNLKEDKVYQAKKAHIERLKEELIQAEEVYAKKNHPRLEERRAELKKEQLAFKELSKTLLPQIRKDLEEYYTFADIDSQQNLKDDITTSKALIEFMTKEMDRLEDAIRKQGPDALQLEEYLAAFKPEEAVLDKLREQRAIMNAEVQESTSSAHIQDKATAFPNQNVKKQIMMAGGAGGAAMGLVLLIIAYWEFRVRRINNVEDVVYGLGWRLVGQLPALPERSRGGLLRKPADPRYWQSLMTESVDATRTMILHAARAEGLRTVMVTSAVSGEGKTSLSCHLACSLARAGRKTLLLDCDLRNPAAHRLFELPGEPGLCEVLRGEAQLADVIRATPAANLWLIPAGQFDEQALQTFTLSQNGFSPLLDQLKTQFDFIVVDSSPVLPVVDTLVIGQNVDVVVFSLLRDVSRIPNVYAAYQRLATLGIRILGAVVNGVDAGRYTYSNQYAKQTN